MELVKLLHQARTQCTAQTSTVAAKRVEALRLEQAGHAIAYALDLLAGKRDDELRAQQDRSERNLQAFEALQRVTGQRDLLSRWTGLCPRTQRRLCSPGHCCSVSLAAGRVRVLNAAEQYQQLDLVGIHSLSRERTEEPISMVMTFSPDAVHTDIERVLFTESQIQQRVRQLGAELSADYAGRTLTLVGVYSGAGLFQADLARAIHPSVTVHLDGIGVSSYGDGTTSNGRPTISQMPKLSLTGRDVVLVEDIVETGATVAMLWDAFHRLGAWSVRVCALLDKQPQLCRAEYLGFACDPVFVVGYGLDYAEAYRNLPYIGVLKPSVYQTA